MNDELKTPPSQTLVLPKVKEKKPKLYKVILLNDDSTKEIIGIHAFIPYSHFDDKLQTSEIFLSIWKVKEQLNIPGLGLRTLNFIKEHFKPRLIQAMAFIKSIEPLYKRLGCEIDYLSHHVLINPEITEYSPSVNAYDEGCLSIPGLYLHVVRP